jgi:hypothetical protein
MSKVCGGGKDADCRRAWRRSGAQDFGQTRAVKLASDIKGEKRQRQLASD